MRLGLSLLFALSACGRTEPWELRGDAGPEPDAGDGGPDAGEAGPDAGEDGGFDGGLDGGVDGGFDGGGACFSDLDCDDGRRCDGRERCVDGFCVAGDPIFCDDGIACTDDQCDEDTGACASVAIDARCDDGLFCTGSETCDGRRGCVDGADPNCRDAIACTTDACDEGGDRCTHLPSDAACDDGLFCSGTETCDVALGCRDGADPSCNDAIACTDDSCNEAANRCDHLAVHARCDDALFCTGTETCDTARGCTDGPDPDCDDGVGCTEDSCNERADACDSAPDDAACDDGRFCNGVEFCDPDADCLDGPAVDCDDSVDCTIDFCIDFFESCINFPLDLLCGGGMTCDPDVGCS